MVASQITLPWPSTSTRVEFREREVEALLPAKVDDDSRVFSASFEDASSSVETADASSDCVCASAVVSPPDAPETSFLQETSEKVAAVNKMPPNRINRIAFIIALICL